VNIRANGDTSMTSFPTADREASGFKRDERGWLAVISATLLLVLLPFSSYIASVPFIKAEWNLNNTLAAVVFSAYLAGYAISSVILIPMTDRISPQRVMAVGVTVLTVGNLLFPLLAGGFWTGALLRFIAGVGHVGAYIAGVQLVSLRFTGGYRGTAVGIFVSAGYAGTTLSYIFMGMLLKHTPDWRIAYLITAGVGALGVLPTLLPAFRRNPPLPEAPKNIPKGRGRLSLEPLKNKALALVNIAYALHTAELYLARLWLPLLLGAALIHSGRDPLESAAIAAALSGFMFMTGIAGVFLGGVLSDRIGRSWGAAFIFSISGVCSFIAGWLVGVPPIFLILLGFIYGFMTAADSAVYSTAVIELSPKDRIGSTQAVQAFIGFSVGAIAPVVAGCLLDVTTPGAGWGLAFGFNGMLAVVGVSALLGLRRLPEASRMANGRR